MAIDAANFAGLSHAGAPPMVRGWMARPAANAARAGISTRLAAVSGACVFESDFMSGTPAMGRGCNVVNVNIKIRYNVDNVNTKTASAETARPLPPRQ